MKINIRNLIFSILVPLSLGLLVGLLTNSGSYSMMNKPSFAPPGFLFPIVWTILYILMGVSYYLVSESGIGNVKDALNYYSAQLIVNLLWSFIFFTFKLYLLAFLWLVLLIVLVIMMIKKFYKINKVSAFLQIPYLIWILFAAVLNLSIYILN